MEQKERNKILDEIAEHLIGTCEATTFESEIEEKGLDDDPADMEYLDKQCFNCSECGWWFDKEDFWGENDGECRDCGEADE